MNRDAVDRWCERGILALVLGILVFGPLAFGAARGREFSVIVGLTAGVVVLWAARFWLQSRPQILWPPIAWAVLGFTLYAIGRYLTADIEYVAREELIGILVYAFLFFAILNNLHRQESIQIISYTLVFLAMAISFYALYQFLTGSDRVWRLIKPYPHRGSGTYICPNHLGGFLEMLLPLGLALALTSRAKAVTKVLLGYASLVMLAGIGATLSRGAWVSVGAALLLFFGIMLFKPRYRIASLVLVVMLLAAGSMLLPRAVFVEMRLKRAVAENARTEKESRIAVWGTAVRMWRDHPWWGVGPGHFDARFRNYRPAGVQLSPERAHNDYLNTLADYGLAGTALVGLAWALLGLGVAQTWRSVRLSTGELGGKSGSNKFACVLGTGVGLVAILVHSVFDFNLHIPANAILAVTLMALLTSFLRFATESYWLRLGLVSKALATIVALGGVVYLVPQAWRMGSESWWLLRAEHEPRWSQRQIMKLSRAFAVEPKNPDTAYVIGEAYRVESSEGGEYYEGQTGENYRTLAQKAMFWFDRSRQLNPWDSRPYAGIGWCLDQLDRQGESGPYFSRAEALDPNNFNNVNDIGFHYVQCGDFAAARPWFERSLRLKEQDNVEAQSYLLLANARLAEAATNELAAAQLNARPISGGAAGAKPGDLQGISGENGVQKKLEKKINTR